MTTKGCTRDEAERLGKLLRLKRVVAAFKRNEAPSKEDLATLVDVLIAPSLSDEANAEAVEQKSVWLDLYNAPAFDFGEDVVTSCHAGKIYQFGWDRNAFWGARNCNFFLGDCTGKSLDEVKTEIERRRRRGTQWWIDEVPVLVFRGTSKALLVGELNVREPIREFTRSKRLDGKLGEIASLFQPDSQHSFLRVVCNTDSVAPDVTPLAQYQSISYGGQYRLAWRQIGSPYDPRPVHRLAARIQKRLNT